MIRITIFCFISLAPILGKTQQATTTLSQFRVAENSIQKKGMTVLAGWGGANIITGAYYSGRTSGPTKYFHQMNMYWGIINGVLGGSALLRLPAAKSKQLSFVEAIKEQQTLEKTFLFNAGLDLAYIASGIAFKESSKNNLEKRDRRLGYGNSLLLQGGFLLLFDGLMYTIIQKNGKPLHKILEQVNFSLASNQASLLVRLQ
ncbi:MAG: hypothetical protein ABIX01_17450 [Chitinophagaceae bacterium]